MSKKDLRRRPGTEPETDNEDSHFIDERTRRSPSQLSIAPDMEELEALLRLAVFLSRGVPAEA